MSGTARTKAQLAIFGMALGLSTSAQQQQAILQRLAGLNQVHDIARPWTRACRQRACYNRNGGAAWEAPWHRPAKPGNIRGLHAPLACADEAVEWRRNGAPTPGGADRYGRFPTTPKASRSLPSRRRCATIRRWSLPERRGGSSACSARLRKAAL